MTELPCLYCGPYMKNWWLFFVLKFSFNWVRRKGPTASIFFHILGLNIKHSYQIASLFDMYIDMGERIAGKQDRPSLIIEDPFRAPQIAQNIHWFFKLFPLVVHISPRSAFADISVPLVPLDFM